MTRYILYARKSQEDEGRQQQSIDDQTRIMKDAADRLGLDVVLSFTEEKSAKEPYQRPIFDKVIALIEHGEADAIICYNVNRLARNMVEGALLQHLLTKGHLKEIRTYNEAFRSGDNILPFILQTAMSTQFSLDLSQIVKRGLLSKVQKGGFPQKAPAGYANDRFDKTVVKDPDRFTLIRKAWDLMLTGSYSLDKLSRLMNDEWGYRTRKSRKAGGTPMSVSTLHRLFCNVFYTGMFIYKGELIQGLHEPMITIEEFDAVQKILRRTYNVRPQKRDFAYTGSIICAACGRQVTAELQTGRHKRGAYTYYHCRNSARCGSGYIRQDDLETEIARYLNIVKVDPRVKPLCIEIIEQMFLDASNEEQMQFKQQNKGLEQAQQQMSKLIKLSIKEMITEDDFQKEKLELQAVMNRLKKEVKVTEGRLERVRQGALDVANFVTTAPIQFNVGETHEKREIAKKLGVMYRLAGGKIEMELNPLLVPFYIRAVEPLTTGSDSMQQGTCVPSISGGAADGTMFELFQQVWQMLMEGAPRLGVPR